MDGCSFLTIELRALPMLERQVCLCNTVELRFHDAELRRARCARLLPRERAHRRQPRRPVRGVKALDRSAAALDTNLWGLRQLLIAEVPSSWDIM